MYIKKENLTAHKYFYYNKQLKDFLNFILTMRVETGANSFYIKKKLIIHYQ